VYYFPIFIGAVLLCFYGVVQAVEAIREARSVAASEAGGGTPRGVI
jgi:TRAP-type C4-dicarboxylate transport system permease small subunit